MDVIHLTSTVPATDNRLGQATSADLASYDIKSFTVGRFRSSNLQDECNITYRNYREELSFEDGLMFKAQSTCDSNLTENRVSKRSSSGLLSRGQNSVESTGDSLLVRDLGLCKKCS